MADSAATNSHTRGCEPSKGSVEKTVESTGKGATTREVTGSFAEKLTFELAPEEQAGAHQVEKEEGIAGRRDHTPKSTDLEGNWRGWVWLGCQRCGGNSRT